MHRPWLDLVLLALLACGCRPPQLTSARPTPAVVTPNPAQDARLLAVAQQGDLAGVKAALAGGANVNAGEVYTGYPLSLAAAGGHVEVVQRLLSSGAAVNRQADEGYTALMEAVVAGHPKVVKVLLENGADPNLIAAGLSPLAAAQNQGHSEIVEQLKQAGAKP